jgi:AFG3 family protein
VRNYVERDDVKKIVISREGNSTKTYATVYGNDNSTVRLTLGNVDHFLENLERLQLEKGKQAD